MAAIKKEDVIEFISTMSVLELSELVKELEEKFGVSAAAAVAAAPAAAVAGEAAAEQTEFDVIMTSFGEKKINVIKEIRSLTGLGLKEAKELVESAGADCKVKEGISKDDAAEVVKKLTAIGATAEVK